MSVEVGKAMPLFRFVATNDSGGKVSDYKGKILILFFYPRDNTPGCTTECENFRDSYKKFQKLGIEVLGISRDNLASHERFKTKLDLPFELIADPDEIICNLFGVMKDKNMYGKKVRGIERSTFIIDAKGKLIHEWRKVKVPGHVDAVLDYLAE